MADQTDLVIAVDSTQVKLAEEALKALGFQATTAEVASDKLAKAVASASKAAQTAGQTGATGLKNLTAEAKRAVAEAEKLANTDLGNRVIRVDTAQVQRAVQELRTLGFQATSVDLKINGLETIREQLQSVKDVRSTLSDLQSITFQVRTDQVLGATNALRNLGVQAISSAGEASALTAAINQTVNSMQELANVPTPRAPSFDDAGWNKFRNANIEAARAQQEAAGVQGLAATKGALASLAAEWQKLGQAAAASQVLTQNSIKATNTALLNQANLVADKATSTAKETLQLGLSTPLIIQHRLQSANDSLLQTTAPKLFNSIQKTRDADLASRIVENNRSLDSSMDADDHWKPYRERSQDYGKLGKFYYSSPNRDLTVPDWKEADAFFVNPNKSAANARASEMGPNASVHSVQLSDALRVLDLRDKEAQEAFRKARLRYNSNLLPRSWKDTAKNSTDEATRKHYEKLIAEKQEWLIPPLSKMVGKNGLPDESQASRLMRLSTGKYDAAVFNSTHGATSLGVFKSEITPGRSRKDIEAGKSFYSYPTIVPTNPSVRNTAVDHAVRNESIAESLFGKGGKYAAPVADVESRFKPTLITGSGKVDALKKSLDSVGQSSANIDKVTNSLSRVGAEANEAATASARLASFLRDPPKAVAPTKQVAALLQAPAGGGGGGGKLPPKPPGGGGGDGGDDDDLPKPKRRTDLSEINSFATAAERAAQASRKMAQTIDSSADAATKSIRDLSKATTSLGASSNTGVDKLTTSLGAAAAKAQEATAEVNRLQVNTSALDKAGTSFGAKAGPAVVANDIRGRFAAADLSKEAENQALLARLTDGTTKAVSAQAAVVGKATHAHDGHWKSVRRTAFEQQQLAYQLHDFTVQILGGQSPFLALVQQGSQLAGTFGGIKGAIGAVAALITPTVAVVGALAAAVIGLGFALAQVESSARGLNTLQTQFQATGRESAFTNDELKKLIQTLQLTHGVSKSAATAIVSEFSKAHEISGELATTLSKLTADFARATGQEIPAAAKALANAFSDPAAGVKALEDALGRLTSGEILAIQQLTNVGNRAGAQTVLLQALERAVKGLADTNRTELEGSINRLGNSWDTLMRTLEKSEGLRTVNALLAKVVDAVGFLIANADKLSNIGINPMLLAMPSVGAPMVAGDIGRGIRQKIFGPSTPVTPPDRSRQTASGKITEPGETNKVPSASAALKGSGSAADDEIKQALKLGESYRSMGSQITELQAKRNALIQGQQTAIKTYGAESAQAKRLGDSVGAVNEQISQLQRRQQSANSQGEQVLDLILKDRINDAKDALTKFRDNASTQDRLLQTAFQLGEDSIQGTFDKRVALIREGTAAELKSIDDQIAAVQDRMKDSKLDPVRRQRFAEQLDDLNREKGLITSRKTNDEIQANDQLRQSYVALKEQVETYRAELLQLQGDEAGAAKVQADAAIRRAQILAGQSAKSGLPSVNVNALRQALDQQNALNRAKEVTGFINEKLSIQEGAIERLTKSGAISEMTAMQQLGQVRQQSVAELEKIVKGMEEVAALTQNKDNWRLQLDTAQAREALEALKASMDPLKEKFDNLFRDSASDSIADFLNGTKTAKEAFNDFGKSILKTMNDIISKEISQNLFGKDGIFKDAGGFMAKIFGKKPGDAPGDTSALAILKSSTDPAATSVSRMAKAADDAAIALNKISGTTPTSQGGNGSTFNLPIDKAVTLANARPGDALDNLIDIKGGFGTVPSGEQSVLNQFKDASDTTTDFGKTLSSAGSSVLQLAAAATKGGGALGILPSIISAISAAASTSSASKGGGDLFGSLFNLFGGSSSGGYSAADMAGLDALISTFHTGGIVGQPSAMRMIDTSVFEGAPRFHSGGKVNGLRSGEVAAILMEDEEVLTRKDPRHRDNMLSGGNNSYLMTSSSGSGGTTTAAGGNTYLQVSVTPPAGGSRESAMQWGAAAGRQMQSALRRNG